MSEPIRYKDADVDETFENDWSHMLVGAWRRDYDFSKSELVRPPVGNGFYYTAKVAGRSGFLVPDFIPDDGQETKDGSLIWVARNPASTRIDAIASHTVQLDSGIVEVNKKIAGVRTQIVIRGGVPGEQYRVREIITRVSGEQEPFSFILAINKRADV